MKNVLLMLLREDHANSRFVYLMSCGVSMFCVLFLCVAFVFTDHRDSFAEVIMFLQAGVLGGGIGRYFARKATPNIESTVVSTTTETNTVQTKTP